MADMVYPHLILFDFSGTLSIQVTHFGRQENLEEQLNETGLWQHGIDHVEVFWNEIVNSTWLEASTTTRGYKAAMFDAVMRVAHARDIRSSEEEIWQSVSAFVDHYFSWCKVDSHWILLLMSLMNRRDVRVVVATDHYAEATDHIIEQLQVIGIESIQALDTNRTGKEVIVANSADIGFHKSNPEFWHRLRTTLGIEQVQSVILVDDFGFNEAAMDQYADSDFIEARKKATTENLEAVFRVPVRVFPFLLNQDSTQIPDREVGERIDQVEKYIYREIQSIATSSYRRSK
jgi:FMN phosphatase YigB (HAD superfamily)